MARADRIGFAGLGIMGSRMAANLARAGHELTVWNRTRRTAEEWVEQHGGHLAATPAALAAASDVVLTMVVDGPQVETILLGPDGVAEAAHPGLLCVDCSTIAPEHTRAMGRRLAEAGVAFADAPVTGSSPKAEDGTLTFMFGGEAEDLERIRPLLEVMGSVIVHAGALGDGEAIKVINNSVAAANAVALGEALLVARREGLDLDALVEVMAAGSGGSAMLALKAGPMREHDFTTLFKLEHMLKDVRLCLEQARAAGAPFPTAAHAGEILAAGMGRGHADADFAALIEVLEGLAGTRL